MYEQIAPVIVVDSEFALNQAISDLKFYWNLARQKNQSFEIEIWANQGAIVLPQHIARRSNEEATPKKPS